MSYDFDNDKADYIFIVYDEEGEEYGVEGGEFDETVDYSMGLAFISLIMEFGKFGKNVFGLLRIIHRN